MPSKSIAEAPPILDFSVIYGNDAAAKCELVETVKKCCLRNGFFQIVGHRIPRQLQENVLDSVKSFFSLPQEMKEKVHKGATCNQSLYLVHSILILSRQHNLEPRLRIHRLPNPRSRNKPRPKRRLLHRRRNIKDPSLLHRQKAQQRSKPMANLFLHLQRRKIPPRINGILHPHAHPRPRSPKRNRPNLRFTRRLLPNLHNRRSSNTQIPTLSTSTTHLRRELDERNRSTHRFRLNNFTNAR